MITFDLMTALRLSLYIIFAAGMIYLFYNIIVTLIMLYKYKKFMSAFREHKFKSMIVGTSPWLEKAKERKRKRDLLDDEVDKPGTENNNT